MLFANCRIALWLLVCIGFSLSPTSATLEEWEKELVLGDLDFQTSCSAEAQEKFEIGLKALHVFWYELALDEFRAAANLDPDCAIAYWGEALTYKHPLWNYEDREAANAALDKADALASPKTSQRETDIRSAARKLFTIGPDVKDNEEDYVNAMKQLADAYPDDIDIQAYYGLSLLGAGRNTTDTEAKIALAQPVLRAAYDKMPHHAGVLHYLIHAFDSPDLTVAIVGSQWARILPVIAKSSCHATHMQSHIWLRLGGWKDSEDSNFLAVVAADTYCTARGYDYKCEAENRYHAIEWLQYVYYQQGRYTEGHKLIDRVKEIVDSHGGLEYKQWYQRMSARKMLDAPHVYPDKLEFPEELEDDYWSSFSESAALLAHGLHAIKIGLPERVPSIKARMEHIALNTEEHEWLFISQSCRINVLLLECEEAFVAGDLETAWEKAEAAVAVENDQVELSTSPTLPTYQAKEFYSERLVQVGGEANLKKVLQLTAELNATRPNRSVTLKARARALKQLGRFEDAQTVYNQLLQTNWQQGDATNDDIREAIVAVTEVPSGDDEQMVSVAIAGVIGAAAFVFGVIVSVLVVSLRGGPKRSRESVPLVQ